MIKTRRRKVRIYDKNTQEEGENLLRLQFSSSFFSLLDIQALSKHYNIRGVLSWNHFLLL